MNSSFMKLPYLNIWKKIPFNKVQQPSKPKAQISKTYQLKSETILLLVQHKTNQSIFKMVKTKISKIVQPTKIHRTTLKNQIILKIMKIFSVNLMSHSRNCNMMRKRCWLFCVMDFKEALTIWPWFIKESKLSYRTQIIFCQEKIKMILSQTLKEWAKNSLIKLSTTFEDSWMSKV